MDLFSSRLNRQLDKFVTWYSEQGSFKVNAFSFSWTNYCPYIFPPFNLIPRVINKLVEDNVEQGILIAPLWMSQSWFPLLMSNMISFPVRLPRHVEKKGKKKVQGVPQSQTAALPRPQKEEEDVDLLTLPHSGQAHPLARKKLTMLAVLLSGRECRCKEFQHQLLISSSHPGNGEPRNNTVWPGKSGIFGIFLERQIPL